MRIRQITISGVAVGVAATLAIVSSATAAPATSHARSAAPKHPVASLVLSTVRPAVGKRVVSIASHSRLPKHDRLRRATVRFGDGSKVVHLRTLKSRAHHAYRRPGTYKVVLTIVDKHGVKARNSKKVHVHAVPKSSPSPTPTPTPTSSGLPISLPGGLVPSDLISSLGLSTDALSSISSLLNIPVPTLSDLPVGFLALLPVGDLTGGGLPSLPGLGSLPLVGNVLGMLLAGLPITIPPAVDPTTLISALPAGTLSALQLTTLTSFFGVGNSVLGSLPVNVLTLLPTGLLSGLGL